MGVCHSNAKHKPKKKGFAVLDTDMEDRINRALEVIIPTEPSHHHIDKSLEEFFDHKLDQSLKISSPSLKHINEKKSKKTHKKRPSKKGKRKTVEKKKELLKKKTSFIDKEPKNSDPETYKEYLVNTKKGFNFENPNDNLEYQQMALEFENIKEIVDRKIEYLDKKQQELELLDQGIKEFGIPLMPPPPKFKDFDMRYSKQLAESPEKARNIEEFQTLRKHISQRQEKIQVKKENLGLLSEQLEVLKIKLQMGMNI